MLDIAKTVAQAMLIPMVIAVVAVTIIGFVWGGVEIIAEIKKTLETKFGGNKR